MMFWGLVRLWLIRRRSLGSIKQSSSVDGLESEQAGFELTQKKVATLDFGLQLDHFACGNIFLYSAKAIGLLIV